MRHLFRLTALARATALVAIGLALATPATAQFGGLKKKLKAAAGATETADQGASPSAPAAPSAAGAGGGGRGGNAGTIVLTDDVLDRLIAGLKAGRAERDAAAKENTPYGQYLQAQAAYAVAEPKCEAGRQSFPTRAAADEKLMARYSAMTDKMVAAGQRQDTKMYQIYADSAMAMQDPACAVHRPDQPDKWYDQKREVDNRAEKKTLETSGFTRFELGAVQDRAVLILQGNPTPDVSAAEKSAVAGRKDELKRLLGMEEVQETRVAKPAPAPAPAPQPAPAPTGPTMSPGQTAMANCMAKNAQKHEKEIAAMGERAKAAQEANNMQLTLAIADSIQRLNMAGCESR